MNGTQDQQSTLGKLRSAYINAGLLSEGTDLAQFSSAPESVRQTLLEQGRAKGLISEATTDEVFMSAWGDTEQKKKDDTESVSEDGSLELPVVEQAERARNLRPTARLNEDGTESTVLMASMEVDGKNVAIPTLFPKDPNNVTSDPDSWIELDGLEAYDMAMERGEVFEFDTPDGANAFAEGSWKEPVAEEETVAVIEEAQPRTESDEFFDMAMEAVTPELVGRSDDDDTVMELNSLLGQYGFTFETAGLVTDAMTVTAKNGQTLDVDLDPWRSSTEVSEAEKLRNFLEENRKESENLLKQEDDYQAAKLKFATEEQIGQRVNQLNVEMNNFQQFSRELADVEAAFNEKYAGIDKYTEEYLRANPEEFDEYKAQVEAYNAEFQGINDLRGQLQHKSQELLYANQEINRAAAEFVEVQGGISTRRGLVKTALSRGTAMTARGLANFVLDVSSPGLLVDMRNDEEFPERFLKAYKELGGTEDVSAEEFEQWYGGLPDALKHDVDMKVFDDLRKLQKYGDEESKGVGDAIYDGIMWATGEDQKPPYAYEMAQQGWWTGSILGAIESIPAFVGLGKKLFTTGFKAASRTARMFGQVTDHVDQEFRDNPELQGVTEQDKLLLKVPLGATVAVLENIGFRNVMANRGLASGILMRVLGRPSLGVGRRSFRETVALEVNNMMARGLLTLGNAGAAEFETGFAQELADIGFKKVWNAVSDNPDLDTPALNEILGQLVNAGAQEAVGSFVLGTPAAVGAAFQKADYASLSDEQLAILEFLSDPGNRGATKPMIAAHLKNLVNQGKLTGKQAKEALDGYESTVQALDGIRDVEGMSSEQKKKALALEVRKRELERRMAGTAKPFQNRLQSQIDDLVIQQEELADAIQEQSTEEVPTRDETEAGPEVGGQVQDEQEPTQEEEEVERDSLFEEIARRIVESGEASSSFIQRKFKIGYQRATQIMDQLEEAGVIGAFEGGLRRSILMDEQGLESLFKPAVEEEVTPTEEEAAVEEEAAELEAAFESEGVPDVTETTEAGVDVQKEEGSELTKKQQRVVDQANNVLTSLKSLIPDIKVIAHQTQLQYEAATGKKGRGTYISDTQGKTIHINLSRANSRTAFHEAFHAIFLEQIKNGDPDAQAKAKVLLNTIAKALPPKSVLKNRIDRFLTQYDQQDISEEALAEVFSYIANGYSGLGPQVKAKIKVAIKNLIESVIGRKLGASWSEGDQAVLDAMEILAGKVERGEAITSEDVGGIEVSEEAAAEVKAETEVDAAIGRIQELRRNAVKSANDLFGDLFVLMEESEKGGLSISIRSLFKSVDDSKLRAIEKKIRDVKKAKKLSDADKAERVAKLEKDAEKEVARLEKAREDAKPGIKEAMAKLEPIAEKKRKEAGLAEIKKKQAAITKKLDKDKKEAKKVYEGEELKEYLAGLKEEAEAKRAALRDEIAELRGEKKKAEPTVEEEEAPEAEATVEEQPTVATIRTKVGVEAFGKLEAAVRDYLEYMGALDPEDITRGQKSASTRRINKVVKLATELGLTDAEQAVMQNSVQEKIEAEKRAAEAKETEQAELKAAAERAKQAAAEEEVTPEEESVLPKESNLGFSDKVLLLQSERKFGKNGVVGVYVDPKTGEIEAVVALPNKANDDNYLGYKRVEGNKFAIKANLSSAEKGSSRPAFEAAVDALPDGHVLVETDNISSDGLILWLNQIRNKYKPTGKTFTVSVNVAGKKINLGGNPAPGRDAFNRGYFTEEEANSAEAKLNELIKDIPGAKLNRKAEPGNQFSFDVSLPELQASSEPTVEEKPTVSEAEPTAEEDAKVARIEEELRQAEEDLDFYNRDEPDNTKYPKYKSWRQLVAAVRAGKDPRFIEAYVPQRGSLGTESGDGYVVYPAQGFQAPIGTQTIIEESAKSTVEEANATRRATKSNDVSGVGQDLENRVEDLKKELAEAKAKKAPVDDVAKRAAVEGISVEELTKREAAVEREAKLNIARSEQRKLDALKGKTDKRSVAERKNIKQFIEDLKTMSVEEARAKRQPSAREQRVAANEYDLKSLKKVGEGSTRVVYDLGDGRVLKRAKNPRGLMQNDAIMWADKNEILLELLPEVYFDEEGADYVIHEKVPRNDSAVRKFLKPLKDVYDENRIPGYRYIHPKVMRQMEEMGLGDFLNYDLLMGDFVRPSSWGQRENGDFVLIDDGTLSRAALEYKFGKLVPVPESYQESWAEVKKLKGQPSAREQRVDVETEGPNIVYRAGNVTDKAEPRGMMDGGRSTGHFGTGAYFFSDRKRAREYAKQTGDRDVTAVDIRDYNLAPASRYLHDTLRRINGRVKYNKPHTFTAKEVEAVLDAIRFPGIQTPEILAQRKAQMPEAERAAKEATRLYNEPGNIDSASTSVMKALGYDGVYATPGSDMDNSTYGTVIYDVKTEPKAREQRVADVVERYEFRPNGSLKNAELAPELRRNLKRYGFGVKQFGTRMDDFHIVNLATGRKVDPKKLIAKDRADEKVEMEQRAELRERDAKERMEREEVEDRRTEELKRYQAQYVDFPGDMIPPSKLSVREQRDDLNDEVPDESTYAVVKFAKERGYSNAAILKFRPGAQQAIDAYEAKENRLKGEIAGVIKKATERIRADKDIQGLPNTKARKAAILSRLEADVLRYLEKSRFYQNASDIGREAMVRNVKKQLGIRVKSAPSANRILNAPIDENGFSENEKKALKQKIRDMARSSRTTAAAIAEARREIAKDVAKLRKDGALTPYQATALLNRMARTNPLNEASVNSFIEYANKVFMDADYAKRMNDLNKMRKRAITNAEKKTGINVDVIDAIRTIAGINAEAIPEEVLEEYTEVIEQLAERKAVLDLENRVSLRSKLETILDAIDQELNAKDELLAEFENFDGKEYTEEGKVSIAKTIKAMVEAGVITKDEAKLLRKYQGELFPEPEGKDEAELQQERDNEKRFLLGVVEGIPELTHKFPTREENVLLRQFNELIKTSGVESLDNAELKNLLRVANNIENGFLPHMAEVLVEKIDADNKRAEIVKSVVNDKSGLARLIDRTGLTSLKGRGRRNPTRYIDQVWGDFKSTRLFDAVFKDLAVAAASYRSDLQGIEARMDKVEDALIKSLGRNPNKVTRAKFLLGAYLMQKEFEANPNAKGVFSAVDLLDATIKKSQKVSTSTQYNDASVEVLQSIRDQIELRTADEIEAIIKKEQGGKQMLAVADEIRKVNDELTPKAQYVAGVIRGVPFMPYSQYMHRVVLKGENEYGENNDKALSDVMNKNMMPSTRAKNLIEREDGSAPAVNFDPLASVNRGAKFVLTDYYMTKPVRTNKRLVNKLGDLEGLNARQKQMVKFLMEGSETLVKDMLVQAVNQDSMTTKVFNYIKRKGYQVTLGQVERAIAELGSNASYAAWVDPGAFKLGTTYRNIYGNDGVDILRNVGSMQTTRLFPGGQGTRFESSGLDQMRAATSPGRAEMRNEAANKGRQIINQTLGRAERGAGAIADYLITKPDQMISRPLWFGSFVREFEARTGQKPDMKKIAENNGEYMDRYSQAIDLATAKADDTSIKAGATDNAFLGMLNGTIRPDQTPLKNVITYINSYMTRFLIFEYVTARTAVQAMVGNGMMRKRDGVRLLAGVSSRMFAYQFIAGSLRDTVASILYGDDDDEKDLTERAFESVVQGLASLVLGNTMGQLGRGVVAIPVELLNRNLIESSGNEYGFGKRKAMPLIDINDDKQWDARVLDAGVRTFGPMSSATRAALQGLELAAEEVGMKKKRVNRARAEQEQVRFLIKAAGAAGVLPFANDINYHYQRYIYKDIDKKKKSPLPGTPIPR